MYANDTDGNVIACSPGLVESDATFELLYSANATIEAGLSRFTGADDGALVLTPGGELSAPDNQLNLSGWPTFTLPGSVDAAQAKELLKYQLVLVQTYFADGSDVAEGTKLQTPGALDNLYAAAAAATVFGPDYGTGAPTPSVWAPTAMSVALNIYDSSAAADPSAVVLMDENLDSGVWSTPGDAGWDRKFYTYTVTVYRQDVGDNRQYARRNRYRRSDRSVFGEPRDGQRLAASSSISTMPISNRRAGMAWSSRLSPHPRTSRSTSCTSAISVFPTNLSAKRTVAGLWHLPNSAAMA